MDRKEHIGILDLRFGIGDWEVSLLTSAATRDHSSVAARWDSAPYLLLLWRDEAPGGRQGLGILDGDGTYAIGSGHEPRR